MSAYVLDPEEIAGLASYLMYSQHRWFAEADETEGWTLDTNPEDALARQLHAMNVSAVCQRYADERPEYHPYVRMSRLAPTPVRAYKLLASYLYQCFEGDVPEWTLYRSLSSLHDRMAHDLVRETAAYQAAPWA